MPEAPILIVDDEDDIRELLLINFEREGMEVAEAATGQAALEFCRRQTPALIVLDLMLPDMSGNEVCRRLRSEPATAETPVIMLTARGEEIDRVVGFEVGADDYVVKANFSVRELVLRVRAVLRRRGGASPGEPEPNQRMIHGVLSVDADAHRVWVEEVEIALTATEFRLLWVLASRPGRVLTRGVLLQDVWDMPPDLNTRTVDTHVKRLREKLGVAARHVETVRGVGYRFNPSPKA